MSHLIPVAEAQIAFIRETYPTGDYIAACAYLPNAYDHCTRCDAVEAHSHPLKSQYTEAEITEAVRNFYADRY